MFETIFKKCTFIHSNASLQCILSILDIILKFSGKKVKIHVLGTDTDPHRPAPDRHALNADPDPDPAK
jgi:hypothetical protein